MFCSFIVFFFQAEDGIRDKLVTGVQTCALPIYQLAEAAKHLGGAGLAWVKRQGEQVSGSVGKHFTTTVLGALGVGDGDAALLTVGPDRVTSPVLDRVRREVIRRLAPAPKAVHAVCWGVGFPLFGPDPA